MSVGVVVRVWKWVYDTDYRAVGVVEKIADDGMLFVCGDWWENKNDDLHKCVVDWMQEVNE
jgi:hypothetical protein